MSRFWSPVVHDLTPYVPGEQPKLANLVKLNPNENPYPPSPQVLAAIQAELGGDAAHGGGEDQQAHSHQDQACHAGVVGREVVADDAGGRCSWLVTGCSPLQR